MKLSRRQRAGTSAPFTGNLECKHLKFTLSHFASHRTDQEKVVEVLSRTEVPAPSRPPTPPLRDTAPPKLRREC